MKANPIELLFRLNELEVPRFISVRNYQNKNGEVSNYTLLAAVEYGKAVAKDIIRLQNVRYPDIFKEIARKELLESLIKNSNETTRTNASIAQSESYMKLGANSRVHLDSRTIMIWAFLRSKKILVKGNYKPSNPGAVAKAKEEIKRELRLSTANFRQFKIVNIKEVAMENKILQIVV